LNADDADDVAKLLDASAWWRVHCNSGASSTMAAVVFGAVFLLGSLHKKEGTRRRVAAVPWGKGKELGFAGCLGWRS
jgi:hypothetical protein